jgi:hypothetical protein
MKSFTAVHVRVHVPGTFVFDILLKKNKATERQRPVALLKVVQPNFHLQTLE